MPPPLLMDGGALPFFGPIGATALGGVGAWDGVGMLDDILSVFLLSDGEDTPFSV